MNRATLTPPRRPTRSVRLKESGYRRRWKPAGRTIRLAEKPVRPVPPLSTTPTV